MKKAVSGPRNSPLSVAASTATTADVDETFVSWDNGSWDSDSDHGMDVAADSVWHGRNKLLSDDTARGITIAHRDNKLEDFDDVGSSEMSDEEFGAIVNANGNVSNGKLCIPIAIPNDDEDDDDDDDDDDGGYDSDSGAPDIIQTATSQSSISTKHPDVNEDENHCDDNLSVVTPECKQPPLPAQVQVHSTHDHEKDDTIKTLELQCNCLELLIMPLPIPGHDTRGSSSSSSSPTTNLHHRCNPNKLPDGTALKTLPNGTSVLVNYERLLQNEATKRILLQRSYTEVVAKLKTDARAKSELGSKLVAAQSDISRMKELVSKLQDTAKINHDSKIQSQKRHWLEQKAKSRTAILTFKLVLTLSILWLAVMNVSIHTKVIKKLVEHQEMEGKERKLTFLRQRKNNNSRSLAAELEKEMRQNLIPTEMMMMSASPIIIESNMTTLAGQSMNGSAVESLEREDAGYASADTELVVDAKL